MTVDRIVEALVFGAVEGLTEFLPVSSTGHLLLLGHVLGADRDGEAWKSFVILIQLGAILAILAVYFRRLLGIVLAIPHDPNARRFVLGVLVAFLPAVLVGVLLRDFIRGVLFETPTVICVSLIVGGIVLWLIDRLPAARTYTDATRWPLSLYLKVGLAQCVAMIPGVSRSGATIAGALVFGADKRSAAEFSFFLAIPTMAGAFTYDLYKSWRTLDLSDAGFIALGFVAAFLSALVVVRVFLDFVSRHGFAPFAIWRIVVGTLGLLAINFLPQGHLGGRTEAPALIGPAPVQVAIPRPPAPIAGG